jgi:hypothetical protein
MIPRKHSRYNKPQFIKPHKIGTGQSIRIFVGTRSFHHTRNARRCYFLAVDQRGNRVDGKDYLLQRETTREKALAFAMIQARQWQAENDHESAAVICLRPDTTYRRAA